LESQLARYALASTALLGLPAATEASIIFTPGPLNGGPNQTVNINFNPLIDSTIDFSIFAGSPGVPSNIGLSAPGTTQFNTGLTPLDFGDPITLANTTAFAGSLMKSSTGPTYSFPWGGVANGSSHYLGVKFNIGAQQHLGWAAISMQKGVPSFTVEGFAYNDVAGESIYAGATPEPSSMVLFAAGAAGILALRRRRRTP
jgi:hypothetical protein